MEKASARGGDSDSHFEPLSAVDHIDIDLVVKLGGAAITDKSVYETLRPEQLGQGAALVSLCHRAGLRVVVVHGAGSFGHFHAKKYKLTEGLKDGNYRGFCETRNSVTKLNGHVVESLTACGLPAVACPAFPSWQTCGGAVSVFPKEVVRTVLTAGLIPVFYGDMVLDSDRGYCVLSGDSIIQTLCSGFRVRRVVFLTDVSGVYDRPPSEQGAQLLHTVQLSDGAVCGDVKLSASANDVTGGMLKKIHSAHNIVSSSCEKTRVFITNVGSHAAQQLCLEKNVDIMELQATEILLQS